MDLDAPAIPGAQQRHVFRSDDLVELISTGGGCAVAQLRIWQRWVLVLVRLFRLPQGGALWRRLARVWLPAGRAVCIVGGGAVGLELAEFLAVRGRVVSVLEPGQEFATDVPEMRRAQVLDRLRKLSVVMINKTQLLKIQGSVLQLSSAGCPVEIAADTVVLAIGARDISDALTEV